MKEHARADVEVIESVFLAAFAKTDFNIGRLESTADLDISNRL